VTRHPLAADRRHWPPEAREEWEERSACLEFDAGMSRSRAEAAADNILREQWVKRPRQAQAQPRPGAISTSGRPG